MVTCRACQRAGLSAAAETGKHRPRVALVIAVHLLDLRRTESESRSLLLLMIGIGTMFVSGRVGGGVAAFSRAVRSCAVCPFLRGACVTLPIIAWPPSATETCCSVTFCSASVR